MALHEDFDDEEGLVAVQRPSGALPGRRVQRVDRPRRADRARGLVVRRPAARGERADPSLIDVRVAGRGHRGAEGRRPRGVPLAERRPSLRCDRSPSATTSTTKSTTGYDFIVDGHFTELGDFEACRKHPAYNEAMALANRRHKYEWTAAHHAPHGLRLSRVRRLLVPWSDRSS